ncbi:MAG: hypothetical protein ABIN39_07720 [candidate division WOR-3 bacterium]
MNCEKVSEMPSFTASLKEKYLQLKEYISKINSKKSFEKIKIGRKFLYRLKFKKTSVILNLILNERKYEKMKRSRSNKIKKIILFR